MGVRTSCKSPKVCSNIMKRLPAWSCETVLELSQLQLAKRFCNAPLGLRFPRAATSTTRRRCRTAG